MNTNDNKKENLELDVDRTCATKLFAYQDDFGFKNDVATVVFGNYGMLPNDKVSDLADTLAFIYEELTDLADSTQVKGVAKVSPMDSFDTNVGISLASLRAELKGITSANARMTVLNKAATKIVSILAEETQALEARKASIKNRIATLADNA